MTLRLTPVTRRRTQSVTVARDTVPSPHSPALSDGRRPSRRSVVQAATTYARYGIHCSWLQETKFIVNLLTLEWICEICAGLDHALVVDCGLTQIPVEGSSRKQPPPPPCVIKTCRSRSKHSTCFKNPLHIM